MKEDSLKGLFKNLKKSWKLVKNQKGRIFLILLFSLLLCVISAITPLLSAKLLLNITNGLFDNLINVALVIFVIEISRNICNYLYNMLFNKYTLDTIVELQCEIAEETLRLETQELDKQSSGVFIDRLNNDTNEIVNIYADLGDSIIDVVTNIGILVAIFIISKIMFVYFILTCSIMFLLEKKRMHKFFEMDKKRRKINENNTGLIGELIRGIRDIKVLNSGNNFLDKTKDKLKESNIQKYNMSKVNRIYRFIIGCFKDVSSLIFIFLGIYLCDNNLITISSFIVIFMYKDKLQGLLTYVTWVIELLRKFNVSADRVFEIIDDNKFKKEKFGNEKLKKVKGDFEFKDVNFSYDVMCPILKGLSFKINANETVAFVGKSGSGKSTIFSLINKLYNVDDNKIFIDGIDINKLDKDSIRNNISIITQSPYIFNFSIIDNLRIVKPNATDEELRRVCKLACLDDFIESLPEKYDTVVGEGGLALSGGQRQRLAIARALLKKTEIILFDEATSALDNETQNEIQKAISNMKGEYTILIVAHRLSTVIDSDRILLIDDGKVVVEGKHEELIKTNKIYKNLYNKELV